MVNYPSGINSKQKTTSFNNRGMSLETLLNRTNSYYLDKDIAVIYKKPTPIKIVKMAPKSEKIIEAYFEKHSTTDYNGVYKGKYIDFEAKSTMCKTAFPLSNFQKCQITHFQKIIIQKAVAFVIIEFASLQKYYLLPAQKLLSFIINNTRKSIPLKYIENNGYEIKISASIILDYLDIVKDLF